MSSVPETTPATPLTADEPEWKALRPLGHEVTRWLAAMAALHTRLDKGRFPEGLTAFLQQWMPVSQADVEVPESFELTLAQEGAHLHLMGGFHPVFSEPRAWALLHLPALRDFWVAELRSSHYSHLLEIIPQAWCLDATPIPPGAVIAVLDLPSWDLASLERTGRSFTAYAPGGKEMTLAEALSAQDAVLVEKAGADRQITARYGPQDGQLVLVDARVAA